MSEIKKKTMTKNIEHTSKESAKKIAIEKTRPTPEELKKVTQAVIKKYSVAIKNLADR